MHNLQKMLKELAEPDRVPILSRFFKTGPGEYGEGDLFRGIRVPALRKLARKHRAVPLAETVELLGSAYHEDRLLALLILVEKYPRADPAGQDIIYRLYLQQTERINSWDLVDVSAHHIVGAHLMNRSRAVLRRLARSPSLWERRIAIISTFYFIRQDDLDETLRIGEILLSDKEDLIHKAVGWMLREVGKRDLAVEENFLKKHVDRMPRTMLRYAIEKFPEAKRQAYLLGSG